MRSRRLGLMFVVGLISMVFEGPAAATGSPGGRIVFAAFEPFAGRSDVFSIRADGTDVRNLTETRNLDEQWPDVTRDGKMIVFRSGNVEAWARTEIYSMDAAGAHLTRLTRNAAADSSPQWTPDGGHVVFMSNRNDQDRACMDWPCNWDIFIIGSDGRQHRQLTTGAQQDIFPTVSPDGKQILFQRLAASDTASALYLMNIDGTNVHRITLWSLKAGRGSWSPDGTRIAFPDQACRACGQSDIWVMDSDGSHRSRVTDTVANESNVAWSPSGLWLTVQVGLGRNSGIDRMRADGTERAHVTSPSEGFAFEPSWGRVPVP